MTPATDSHPVWLRRRVSFNCTIGSKGKDFPVQKLGYLQLALALYMLVVEVVNEARIHNGFCFVRRINAIK